VVLETDGSLSVVTRSATGGQEATVLQGVCRPDQAA
jgi:hypothetical protein